MQRLGGRCGVPNGNQRNGNKQQPRRPMDAEAYRTEMKHEAAKQHDEQCEDRAEDSRRVSGAQQQG